MTSSDPVESHKNNPEETISFVYKGVEYDATHFADKHPGGK
jgi:cytochrome b involved in lipid metabolism